MALALVRAVFVLASFIFKGMIPLKIRWKQCLGILVLAFTDVQKERLKKLNTYIEEYERYALQKDAQKIVSGRTRVLLEDGIGVQVFCKSFIPTQTKLSLK